MRADRGKNAEKTILDQQNGPVGGGNAKMAASKAACEELACRASSYGPEGGQAPAVLKTTKRRGEKCRLTKSADTLFTEYKQQPYVELTHHQFKTPLQVRPIFLKIGRASCRERV